MKQRYVYKPEPKTLSACYAYYAKIIIIIGEKERHQNTIPKPLFVCLSQFSLLK